MAAKRYKSTLFTVVIKSRDLSDGTFEANTAMFFKGKKMTQEHATGKTRNAAMRRSFKGVWC
jgi:hypothetical protein